jgi:hypothetical protein
MVLMRRERERESEVNLSTQPMIVNTTATDRCYKWRHLMTPLVQQEGQTDRLATPLGYSIKGESRTQERAGGHGGACVVG